MAGPNHPDRVVTPSRGLPVDLLLVPPASSGPVCHHVRQQIAWICITGTRPPSLSSGCIQPILGGGGESGSLCLPTSSYLGKSGEVAGLPMHKNHCPSLTQHDLVLGPSDHVEPDPIVPAKSAQSLSCSIRFFTGIC